MFRVKEVAGRFVELEASGMLSKRDYEKVIPQLERIIESEGKLRALIELEDFEGWEPQGMLEDLRFDLSHRKDFDRVAIVGDRRLHEWATRLLTPFLSGEFRFFEREEADVARQWVTGL